MKTKVAILYGGRSVEHGVSINSARNVYQHICKDTYEPIPIGINKEGDWYHTSGISADIEQGNKLSLSLNRTAPTFLDDRGAHLVPDVIFPVLHGTDGEDGSVQGLFQTMGLPVVGSGVLGSSVAINKVVAKQLLLQSGLPVAPHISFMKTQAASIKYSEIIEQLGSPIIVKPASLGSSVGVSKVENEADFKPALEKAFSYDTQVLLEKFIAGREVECAVIGNQQPVASMPGEILIASPKYDFYTFEAKYIDDTAVEIKIPADIPPHLTEKIQANSIRAYQALHCQDFARVDLFITDDGEVYVNEINTIPGFTNSSMFPLMWQERGIPYPNLITRLIDFAIIRHQADNQVNHHFSSTLK